MEVTYLIGDISTKEANTHNFKRAITSKKKGGDMIRGNNRMVQEKASMKK